MLCHLTRGNFIGGAILYGTVTGVTQTAAVEHLWIDLIEVGRGCVNQLFVGIDKEHQHLWRHLVSAVFGVEQLRERDFSGIARLVLYVAAGTAHHHLFEHGVAQLLVYGIDTRGKCFGRDCAALRHQRIVVLNPWGEGVGDVAHAIEGATGSVLEQQQLVLDILGSIVERCG